VSSARLGVGLICGGLVGLFYDCGGQCVIKLFLVYSAHCSSKEIVKILDFLSYTC